MVDVRGMGKVTVAQASTACAFFFKVSCASVGVLACVLCDAAARTQANGEGFGARMHAPRFNVLIDRSQDVGRAVDDFGARRVCVCGMNRPAVAAAAAEQQALRAWKTGSTRAQPQ
jgi:hypothetical protein